MSEKYIDLAERIAQDTDTPSTSRAAELQEIALRWLDEHPAEVPKPTITESEVNAHILGASSLADACRQAVRNALGVLGITVVPDPEPMRPITPGTRFSARLLNSKNRPNLWMIADDDHIVRLGDGYLIRGREFDAHWKVTSLEAAPGGDGDE